MSEVDKCGHGGGGICTTVDTCKLYHYTNLCDSIRRLTVWIKNRSVLACTGCSDYRHWYWMTGTLCWAVTIWSGCPQRGREVGKSGHMVDMGRGVNTCQNFVDVFYGWTFGPFCVYLFTSQACKMNEEDAIDRCKWKKMIKDVRWSGWVWVGECFFWYRPTRVVPNQRPLNGCVCVCVCVCVCMFVYQFILSVMLRVVIN